MLIHVGPTTPYPLHLPHSPPPPPPHSTNCPKTLSPKPDSSNIKSVVLQLYHALSSRDVDTVQKLLAPDLEWWFHGPPSHQYMM
ncbi:putative wound-induced protein Wun1 [Helianthus anomalus]